MKISILRYQEIISFLQGLKDDNTATYQNEINLNKSHTISHYKFERSKSENNINLDAPDKTRQESLSSLYQESGTALEINNGVIQENEINAIKSVECMYDKTSSKQEIKSHFNESEDEPFLVDASEDEFIPNSLDESAGSITSRSSFGVSDYMPANIKRCKRKLKFAGFLCTYFLNVYLILNIFFIIYTLNVDRDVDCQPSI
jgi:hypothetical protein